MNGLSFPHIFAEILFCLSLSCISWFSPLNSVILIHWSVCLSVSLSPLSHTHRVFITINLKHFEKKKILATYWPHVPVSCSSEWKKIPVKRGWGITVLQGNMLILSNIILVCPQLHVPRTFQKLRKHHLWKRSGENDEETNVYLQISFIFFWLEGKNNTLNLRSALIKRKEAESTNG